MKYLRKFNESIIDYKSENIDSFYNEVKNIIENSPIRNYEISLEDCINIGNKYDIEVVNYDTFYNELPENDKKTAPPKNIPAFALVNPVTIKPRIVLKSGIDKRSIDFIYHMLKHENIHIKQHGKRPNYKKDLPDPNDRSAYYSDYDEIMAYSQSIVDILINMFKPVNIKEALDKLNKIQLYTEIKRNVNSEILKKYHKYIYLYLKKELVK